MTAVSLPAQRLPLAELAPRLAGRLHLPEKAGHDELPAAVVQAADSRDVAEVVRFAARHGVAVAVQATGAGPGAGCGGGLLVHTGRLDECVVHPQGWARVGAGVCWQQVLDAAAPQGLAPLTGCSPSAGVVGSTTLGGLGPVARTYGLACDRVRAFEIVTGDGVLRRVTPTEHPDLFWGLRGGGGALGIVTAVELDLLAVETLYGGTVLFAASSAAEVLATWRAWCDGLPQQATASVALLHQAGRAAVAVRFAWTGDVAAGAAVLAPVRAGAPVLLDDVGVLTYPALAAAHADPVGPGPVGEAHVLLDELPPAALAGLLSAAWPGSGPPQRLVELRLLGGAVARAPERPSAVCSREAAFCLRTLGSGDPAAVLAAAAPGPPRPAYDPEVLHRLAELAAHYDPHRILVAARAVHP